MRKIKIRYAVDNNSIADFSCLRYYPKTLFQVFFERLAETLIYPKPHEKDI